jgi:ferrous iron transport protein A
MVSAVFPLSTVRSGKEVTLVSVKGGRGLRARLTDMGLSEGMRLRVIHSHRPGPCIILAGSTRLVLGHGMTQKVMVRED